MNEVIEETSFTDNLGYLHTVEIEYLPNEYLNITSYLKNLPSGHMYIDIEKNNRLFLKAIYCYDEFRGRGIATKINNIADSLLKNFEGYFLRGIYNPTQLRKDRLQERPWEELDRRAKSFYEKNGYTIIKLEDYLENPSMYPGVSLEDDFKFDGSLVECIVIKKIAGLKNSEFMELESEFLDLEKGKRVL